MIHRRASALGMPKWVAPSSLHSENARTQPDGKIYNTITHGIRNMPAYGHMIPVDDRWKIVMYVRALQRSQRAAGAEVPASERSKLQ